MKNEMLEKQSKIHNIFETMGVLEEVEWVNLDDSCAKVCSWCDGFHKWKWDLALEGHSSSCKFVSVQGKLFKDAVDIASGLKDGNVFLNLVVGLFLGSRQPVFGRWEKFC